jgi:membrane protein
MGDQTAQLLQTAVASASHTSSGAVATIVGLLTFILTASGAFGEMQSALTVIWKAKHTGTTFSRLVKAPVISRVGGRARLPADRVARRGRRAHRVRKRTEPILPFGRAILSTINLFVSFVLIAVLFTAIYKILPDRPLAWRDVILGAVVTTALFTAGKSIIALYIGSSATVSSYGVAGALIALLLWVYYSAQIMRTQIIMDTSGDTRHQFDPGDRRAVAEAERRFVELTRAGFIAAKRTGNGTSELIRLFDPTAQETVFIPRLVGG